MRKHSLQSGFLLVLLFGFAILSLSAAGQTSAANQWTWMGGSNTVPWPARGQAGVYGTLGTPAAGNIPGGRSDAAGWTDGKGHLWLFGGLSTLPDGVEVWFNDLWEFNPSNNEWAWMGGSNTPSASGGGLPGVYGALGTPAAGNNPGSRMEAVAWTDNSGNLWLFGGVGYDSHTTPD